MRRRNWIGLLAGGALCAALIGTSRVAAQNPEPPPDIVIAPEPPPEGITPPAAEGLEMVSAAVGTTISYQGQIKKGGVPANGQCDMAFRLYDSASGGAQVGSPVTQTVPVTGGLFTVGLNFGTTAFEGDARWLGIHVRCPSGSGGFTALDPRQPLYAAPYALTLRPGATVSATLGGNVLNLENYSSSGRALYLRNVSGSSSATVRADNEGNSWAIYATTNGGVGIQAQSTFNTGVLGIHDAITGTAPGVHGRTDSQSGSAVGVLGEVNTTSAGGSSAAVRGINKSTTGSGIGVWGSQAGSGWGVYGSSTSGRGVYAFSSGSGVSNPALYAYNSRTGAEPSGIAVYAQNASADATIVARNTSTGDAYRSISSGGSVVFAVRNNGRVWTSAVQIYGGGDLAERFEVGDDAQVEPGTLMVIDENNPGKLKMSAGAYDSKVAGIVSGAGGVNPGLTLHQEGVMEGDAVIAIAGRVYVKADASYGTIQPGDLLTTSDTPGHVMKAADRDRAQGAVIGKAMTGLDAGTGLVLVLVNLQ